MIEMHFIIDGEEHAVKLPDGSYIAGRTKTCDVVVKEPSVSGQHVRLDVQGNQVEFRDLLSRNGTHVKGERQTDGVLLPGQHFRMGKVKVWFSSDVPVEAETPLPFDGEGIGEETPADASFLPAAAESHGVAVAIGHVQDVADEAPARAPVIRVVIVALIVIVAILFGVVIYKHLTAVPVVQADAKMTAEDFRAAMVAGVDLYREGRYAEAVKRWRTAEKQYIDEGNDDPRIGRVLAAAVDPFAQAQTHQVEIEADWLGQQSDLLQLLTENRVSSTVYRFIEIELEPAMRRERKVLTDVEAGQDALERADYSAALVAFRSVPATSVYAAAAQKGLKEAQEHLQMDLAARARDLASAQRYEDALEVYDEYRAAAGDDPALRDDAALWEQRLGLQQRVQSIENRAARAESIVELRDTLAAARELSEQYPAEPIVTNSIPDVISALNEAFYFTQLETLYRNARASELEVFLRNNEAGQDARSRDLVNRFRQVKRLSESAATAENAGAIEEAVDAWGEILRVELDPENQYRIEAERNLKRYPLSEVAKLQVEAGMDALRVGNYYQARTLLERAERNGADVSTELETITTKGRRLFNEATRAYREHRFSESEQFANDALDCLLPDDSFYSIVDTWMRKKNIQRRDPPEE